MLVLYSSVDSCTQRKKESPDSKPRFKLCMWGFLFVFFSPAICGFLDHSSGFTLSIIHTYVTSSYP